MVKQQHLNRRILKNIQTFREKQRKTSDSESAQVKNDQYRELQNILSPFWAWRG